MTGIIVVDKPQGATSTGMVNLVKGATRCACGHFGTLDPFASGVLPVGVGNATRLFDYFLSKTKRYAARFCFGATTPTLDTESAPVAGGGIPREEEIQAALFKFRGTFLQLPPAFSAKCVDGKRSYELARLGAPAQLSPKEVTVEEFALAGRASDTEFDFTVTCSAGTYIRALARDLAAALGTQAYCTALRRTACGPFSEETAVPPERIKREGCAAFLIPTEQVLPFPVLEVDDPRYYNGVRYEVGVPDGTYKIYRENAFYGTGAVEGGVLRPLKKLC